MVRALNVFSCLFITCASAYLQFRTTPPTAFVLIGDSTTATQTGWGNGFCGSTRHGNIASVAPGTPCFDTAHGGATTGTFVSRGHFNYSLEIIRREVKHGRRTLVTIQFGQNDHILPPKSMGANLTSMVQQIPAIGGEPVLVTALTQRIFYENGTLVDTLEPWVAETIHVSRKQQTHLLNLHHASMVYLEAIGPKAAHRLNWHPNDNTHLNVNGSTVFGRMVADLLMNSYHDSLPIIPNSPLTYNITHGIASF